MSHTEIVNYSFVLRWVGVIWKRDGAGSRDEYRVDMDGERRRIGWNTRADGRERERDRERASDAGCAMRRGRENETVHSCFIGPLRPVLVTEVGWAVVATVRARGKTKNEDEVNDIHAGYRILPSRPRLPSFRLSFFSLSLSPSLFASRSPTLFASRFLRLTSLMDTLDRKSVV